MRLCRAALADTRCRRDAERTLARGPVKSKRIAGPFAEVGARADEVIE